MDPGQFLSLRMLINKILMIQRIAEMPTFGEALLKSESPFFNGNSESDL